MTIDVTYLVQNWKSTVQSILTVTLAVTGYLMASSTIKPHTAIIIGTVNGVAKVILGVLQQDGVVSPPDATIKTG